MKTTTFFRLAGYFMVLLVIGLGSSTLRAGGAAYPFRQTWVVHWASQEDSLRFRQYLDGKPVESACDVQACDACRSRGKYPSWPIVITDCPVHGSDPHHICTSVLDGSALGILGRQQAMAAPEDRGKTPCSSATCLHCRLGLPGQAPKPHKLCSHHKDNAVHYCHGVVVTHTEMRDAHQMHWQSGMGRLVTPAVKVGADAHGAVLVEIKVQPQQFLTLPEAQALTDVPQLDQAPAPKVGGRFAIQLEGMPQRLVRTWLWEPGGQMVEVHQTRNGFVMFDVAGFSEGVYRIEAADTAGMRWQGTVDLRTGVAPTLDGMGNGSLDRNW